MSNTTVALSAMVAAAAFIAANFAIVGIDGDSMAPTLPAGSIAVIHTTAFGLRFPAAGSYLIRWGEPRPDDIIAFSEPISGVLAVKRCVAVGGEPIHTDASGIRVGRLWIPISHETRAFFEAHDSVPRGNVFVAGDSPAVSLDSRLFGFVPNSSVWGRVTLTVRRGPG